MGFVEAYGVRNQARVLSPVVATMVIVMFGDMCRGMPGAPVRLLRE